MEQAQSVVGIDVSKKKIDIALLRNGKTKSKALNNTPEGHVELLAWLVDSKVDMATVHICMEATGVYYEALALAMHDAGLKVSVVNPSCIKGFDDTDLEACIVHRSVSSIHPVSKGLDVVRTSATRTTPSIQHSLRAIARQ